MNSKAPFAFALAAILGLGGYTVFKLADGLGTPKAETTAVALQALPKSVAEVQALPRSYSRITRKDFGLGYVLTRVGTGETFDFTAPVEAAYATNWYLRGAASGYQRLRFATWGFPYQDGAVHDLPIFANAEIGVGQYDRLPALFGQLGVIPVHNWQFLPASCAATFPPKAITVPERLSTVWWDWPAEDRLRLTWQNCLLDRETEQPVSFQANLNRDGSFDYRLRHTGIPDTNALFGTLYALSGVSNATSLSYHKLELVDMVNDDRDRDGLTTEQELLDYGTEPGLADTDFDNVPDGQEIAQGTNPLHRDTDGDGYMDDTDPDPLHTTSWAATGADGFPDAWRLHWFGNAAVSRHADPNGDGIDNAASLYVGVCPTSAPPRRYEVSAMGLPVNQQAWQIAPTAFAFDRPSDVVELVSRECYVYRTSPWQQYFLTSNLERPEGWHASDLEITWSAGEASGVLPTNGWDSARIPLATNALVNALRITLTATGPRPALDKPLYLVSWIPHIEFGASEYVQKMSYGRMMVMVQNSRQDNTWSLPYTRTLDDYPHWDGIDDAAHEQLSLQIVPGLVTYGTAFTVDEPMAFDFPAEGQMPSVQVVFYEVDWDPWYRFSALRKWVKDLFRH